MRIWVSKRFARTSLIILMLVALSLCITTFALRFYVRFLGQDLSLRDISLLDVGTESNIPTWFSSSLLLLCSALLVAITSAAKRNGLRYTFRWGVLSIIFVFLSMTEATTIHEVINGQLRSRFNTGGLLYQAWVVPAGVFVAIFVLAYLGLFLNLPPRVRRLFMAGGALYVLGALGMEMTEGAWVTLYGDWRSFHGTASLVFDINDVVEEFLEMAGTIVFVYALLRYTDYLNRLEERLQV